MFAEIFDARAWAEWFAGLDRSFVFLLLLPLVVAVVGLWGSYLRDEDEAATDDERDRET